MLGSSELYSAPTKKGRKKKGNSSTESKIVEGNDFPVVITTYEMVIRDRVHLSKFAWGYIVVDEGHRLKNFDSKLMRELKQYTSACRMVLTGTPLHVRSSFTISQQARLIVLPQNNLAELWSLLNFVLPDIFGDLDSWQQWSVLCLPHTPYSHSYCSSQVQPSLDTNRDPHRGINSHYQRVAFYP